MPTVQVEVSDDGNVGTLPEALQKLFDAKFNEAFGKGKAKAAEEAKSQMGDPVERERLKLLEAENSRLKEAEARAKGDAVEAEKIRNQREAQERADWQAKLDAAAKDIDRRTTRLRELTGKEIRAAAMAAGARPESLDELEVLLGGRIGLDDALQAFVRNAQDAGKPLLDKDGKSVSIEGFVGQYLADHPHHKAAPGGRGMGGGGGRSLAGQPLSGVAADKAAALEEVAKQPSVANVARAFGQVGRSA